MLGPRVNVLGTGSGLGSIAQYCGLMLSMTASWKLKSVSRKGKVVTTLRMH